MHIMGFDALVLIPLPPLAFASECNIRMHYSFSIGKNKEISQVLSGRLIKRRFLVNLFSLIPFEVYFNILQ